MKSPCARHPAGAAKRLQTQINPHFVYNTLNIISAKSMESGNYEVIEICDQFAQMLRYATDTRSRTATMARSWKTSVTT